jgi:hypothetical protein
MLSKSLFLSTAAGDWFIEWGTYNSPIKADFYFIMSKSAERSENDSLAVGVVFLHH